MNALSPVERAIAAYGGADRWRDPGYLEASVDTGGLLLPLKRRRPQRNTTLKADVHEQLVVFEDFGGPGQLGVFDRGDVTIRRGDETLAARRNARRAFRWSLRRQVSWDDLDFLYFAPYAWWTYLLGPAAWLRDDVAARAIDDRTIEAIYGPALHTHCSTQRFHLDDQARVVRHDYTAEVISPLAISAHFSADHRDFDGVPVATRRRVRARFPGGLVLPGLTLIALRVHSFAHHRGRSLRESA